MDLNKIDTFRLVLFGSLLGAVLTRTLSVILPLSISDFQIHLSFIAMIVLCLSSVTLLSKNEMVQNSRFIFTTSASIGVILDETFILIVRNPPLIPGSPSQVGYWGLESILFSCLCLTVFSGIVLICNRQWDSRVDMPRLTLFQISLFAVILYGGLATFQISQSLIRYEVPNAERSLVILGYEIHHIVQGQFMLIISFILMIFAGGRRGPRILTLGLVMIGELLVADQILYYQFDLVTDARYFDNVTILSGIFMSSLILYLLIGMRPKESVSEEG